MAGKRGGWRPGAGRKPKGGRPVGARQNQAVELTRRLRAEIAGSGISPLDVLMMNLRFWHNEVSLLDKEIRLKVPDGTSLLQIESTPMLERYFKARETLEKVALDGAPFVHPRISPVETPTGGPKDLSSLTDAELDALERISRKIAGAYGNPGGKGPAKG